VIYDTVEVNIWESHLVSKELVNIEDISLKNGKLYIKDKGYRIHFLSESDITPIAFAPDYDGFPRIICKSDDLMFDWWLEDTVLKPINT